MGLIINLKADTNLVDRSLNTNRFYKDLRDYKAMTAEEEIKWFDKMKNGKTKEEREKAKEYIIKCNQGLVVAAAKHWATTETLMDYTNEANIGLIKAIEAFDHTRGVKFASFAMWYIKRSMNECSAQEQIVKRTNYSKTFHVISKATNKFVQKNERMPTSDELMEIVNSDYNKSIKDKNDLLNVQMSRIDYESDDDNEYVYGDITDFNKASASYNEYEIEEKNSFNKEFISKLFKVLTPREQEIIKMRFGISDNGLISEYKISEIAERFNITKERVRQIEKDALKKMKSEYLKTVNKLL